MAIRAQTHTHKHAQARTGTFRFSRLPPGRRDIDCCAIVDLLGYLCWRRCCAHTSSTNDEWQRALRCVGGAEPYALESAQAGQARTARIQTTDHTDVGTRSRTHFRSAARAATTVYWLASCAARTWRVRFLGLGLGLADGRRPNEMRRRELFQDLPVELERALRRTTPVGVHLQQRADARDQQLVRAPCCVTCAACRRPTPSAISEQIGRVCTSRACTRVRVRERA